MSEKANEHDEKLTSDRKMIKRNPSAMCKNSRLRKLSPLGSRFYMKSRNKDGA